MKSSHGFTLIEVVVALILGSIAVLLAHATLSASSDLAVTANSFARSATRMSNARRLLERIVGTIEVGSSGGHTFEGEAHRLEATVWIKDDPRTASRLTLSRMGDGLTASFDHQSLTLLSGADSICFDYLLERGAETAWQREWHSPVSAPVAVRLRLWHGSSSDTLLFAVGDRG